MELHEHDSAPDFTLPDQHGRLHRLSQYRGQWVLLYFYPKDDTPGCTKEACGIRDHFAAFTKSLIVVLGVSADTIARHKKFANKYRLPFTLLADEPGYVLRKYGVWGKKSFFGKVFLGIKRTSFLIDPQGVIAKVYPKVRPDTHAAEVLADIKQLKIA